MQRCILAGEEIQAFSPSAANVDRAVEHEMLEIEISLLYCGSAPGERKPQSESCTVHSAVASFALLLHPWSTRY